LGDLRKRGRKNPPETSSFLSRPTPPPKERVSAVHASPANQPLRVLLVDDDPVFRELLAFVVRADAGAEIVGQAADGARGVELALELQPDVIVMDLLMPQMDGFEATRRIAAAVPDARVLVVSSSTDPEHIQRACEAGAAGFVPKDRAVAELPGEVGRLRPAKREAKGRALSFLFARRLIFG
jgi:CheY-like chemotaxis protein